MKNDEGIKGGKISVREKSKGKVRGRKKIGKSQRGRAGVRRSLLEERPEGKGLRLWELPGIRSSTMKWGVGKELCTNLLRGKASKIEGAGEAGKMKGGRERETSPREPS